jgi:arsenite methyltransferase
MSTVLHFDERITRIAEAIYETVEAANRRQTLIQSLLPKPGERVLDIGTGPGFVANELADAVGPTGTILGVDISEPMLQLARRRCAEKAWVQFEFGDATRLPVSDADFDIAVSVQIYEYIHDIEAALAELHRILRPGGRAAIITTDWRSIVWNAADEHRMQRVLAAFAEHCAYQDLPRMLGPKLRTAGFALTHQQVLPQFNPIYEQNLYSHRLAAGIRAFVPGRKGVTEQEATEWMEDLQQLGEQGNYFFCLNQYLFLVAKAALQ